jgi:hypothetical protein
MKHNPADVPSRENGNLLHDRTKTDALECVSTKGIDIRPKAIKLPYGDS